MDRMRDLVLLCLICCVCATGCGRSGDSGEIVDVAVGLTSVAHESLDASVAERSLDRFRFALEHFERGPLCGAAARFFADTDRCMSLANGRMPWYRLHAMQTYHDQRLEVLFARELAAPGERLVTRR